MMHISQFPKIEPYVLQGHILFITVSVDSKFLCAIIDLNASMKAAH